MHRELPQYRMMRKHLPYAVLLHLQDVIWEATMSAQIYQFPVASPIRQATAGCMQACWVALGGASVDIEAISRLHQQLSERRPGRRDASSLLRQLQAASGWLEHAHRIAIVQASSDGETVGEDADEAACRACDLVGALALLSMCRDALRPGFSGMSNKDIEDAWTGLQLEHG